MDVLGSLLVEMPSWMLLTLGFFLSLRVLKFPDLTVDQSFLAGGVASAVAAMRWESSLGGMVVAGALGVLAGGATAGLYNIQRTPMFKLLSSALVLLSFYSVNLRLVRFNPNPAFYDAPTFMNRIIESELTRETWWGGPRLLSFFVGLVLVATTVAAVMWILRSELGVALRTVGARPDLLKVSGRQVGFYTAVGLCIANGIVALGGWFYGSVNRTINVHMHGYVIHALAGVVIGEIAAPWIWRSRFRFNSVRCMVSIPIIGAGLWCLLRVMVLYGVDFLFGSEVATERTALSGYDRNIILGLVVAAVIWIGRLVRRRVNTYEAEEL